MNTRRLLPITLLVAALGVTAALPSAAQNTTGAPDRSAVRTDDGRDWGWLGLLGLAGLAGLKRRNDRDDYNARPAR